VLMGWEFAAAEFIGGPIMIVLLALVGGFVFAPRLVNAVRRPTPENAEAMTTKAGWTDAATYTISDVNMLRRDLVIGYLVAGAITVWVPMSWWNELFLHGHGFWTTLENVLLGPLIALVSFVCSIGNVPMAAGLWHGGISFGGVVSFIFGDLITFPLILIYRKYYGGALTVRIVATFWAVMAIAGLAVEGLFALFHAVPTSRPDTVVPEHLTWNYTTVLNIAFLVVFAVLYWLYRHRDRSDDSPYAIDPVCGMQVKKANAPARTDAHWFCSDHCKEQFDSLTRQ